MAEQQKAHINKGLVLAALLAVIDIVLQLSHQKMQPWVLYADSIVLLIGVVVAVQLKKSNPEEAITFSNLFGYGFKVSVVTACILFLYTILSLYLFFPDFVTDIYNQSILRAQKTNGFDAAKVAQNKEMAIKVIRISTLSSVVMYNLAVGIVGAALGAIIKLVTRTNKK